MNEDRNSLINYIKYNEHTVERSKTETPRKKKKKNINSDSIIGDINNGDSKKSPIYKNNKLLEHNFNISNECFKMSTPKRKKRDKIPNSKDFITEEKSQEIIRQNIEDFDSKSSMNGNKKFQNGGTSENTKSLDTETPRKKNNNNINLEDSIIGDINNGNSKKSQIYKNNELLEYNFNISNECFEMSTPKRTKRDKIPNSKDFIIEEKSQEIIRQNIENCDSKSSMNGNKKLKNGGTSENTESLDTETPRKKKKNNKTINLEDSIIGDINDCNSKKSPIYKNNELLEYNFNISNECFEMSTPKRKKRDKIPNSKDFIIEEKSQEIIRQNIENYDSKSSMNGNKKLKNGGTSENTESLDTETPRKKKKNNKTINLEDSIIGDINDCNSKKSPINKNNELLEYNFNIRNESFNMSTTKKKKCDENIYSKNITSPKKKKKFDSTKEYLVDSYGNVFDESKIKGKQIKKLTKNKKVDSINTTLANKNNYDISFYEGITSLNNKNELNDEKVKKLEELQNILNLCESKNSETKINFKKFNLTDCLLTKSSLINHPNYKEILKYWVVQHNKIINCKCEMVTQSDIVLLKFIGRTFLENIIDLLNDLKSIQGLNIQVPVESKKNKIHYVETTLAAYLSEEKMKIIKEINPSVKLGVFNNDEDNIILKYWSKFQKEHKISVVQPFLINNLGIALPTEQKLKFVRYISTELPNRLLISVFNRFNMLFKIQANKLSFKTVEDQLILKIENCDALKNKFAILSLILNRTRLQLYRRLNTLKMIPSRNKRIIWDSNKQQELFTNILLETNTANWEDLQNMTIKKDTWIKIATRFCSKDINYEKVKTQWKFLSTMLFCETPIQCSSFKIIVLEYLLKLKPKYWTDINWIDVTNKLYPGANSKIINTMFRWWIHNVVPINIRKNVEDTLLYLVQNQQNFIENKIQNNKNKELKMLTVQNDVLLEV